MNNDREIAKEYIDKLSTQDLDKILTLLNLMTTKKGLYYENIELKQEIERLHSIIKEVREFKSINEAGRETKSSIGTIHNCCVGKSKSCNGYKWKFVLDKVEDNK